MTVQPKKSNKFGSAFAAFEQSDSVPSAFAHTVKDAMKDTDKLGTRKFAPKNRFIKPDVKVSSKNSDLEGLSDVLSKVKKEDVAVQRGAVRKFKVTKQISMRLTPDEAAALKSPQSGTPKKVDWRQKRADDEARRKLARENIFKPQTGKANSAGVTVGSAANTSTSTNTATTSSSLSDKPWMRKHVASGVNTKKTGKDTKAKAKAKTSTRSILQFLDDAIVEGPSQEAIERAAAKKAALEAPLPPPVAASPKYTPTKRFSSSDGTTTTTNPATEHKSASTVPSAFASAATASTTASASNTKTYAQRRLSAVSNKTNDEPVKDKSPPKKSFRSNTKVTSKSPKMKASSRKSLGDNHAGSSAKKDKNVGVKKSSMTSIGKSSIKPKTVATPQASSTKYGAKSKINVVEESKPKPDNIKKVTTTDGENGTESISKPALSISSSTSTPTSTSTSVSNPIPASPYQRKTQFGKSDTDTSSNADTPKPSKFVNSDKKMTFPKSTASTSTTTPVPASPHQQKTQFGKNNVSTAHTPEPSKLINCDNKKTTSPKSATLVSPKKTSRPSWKASTVASTVEVDTADVKEAKEEVSKPANLPSPSNNIVKAVSKPNNQVSAKKQPKDEVVTKVETKTFSATATSSRITSRDANKNNIATIAPVSTTPKNTKETKDTKEGGRLSNIPAPSYGSDAYGIGAYSEHSSSASSDESVVEEPAAPISLKLGTPSILEKKSVTSGYVEKKAEPSPTRKDEQSAIQIVDGDKLEVLRQKIKSASDKFVLCEKEADIEMKNLKTDVAKQKAVLKKEFDGLVQDQRSLTEKQLKKDQKALDREKAAVEDLQAANKRLRATKEKLPKQMADTLTSNESLKLANEEIEGHVKTLEKFTKKLQADNDRFTESNALCRDEYLPRYRQELYERKQFGDTETKIKSLYKTIIYRIAKSVDKTNQASLSENVTNFITEAEKEVNPKFDPKFVLANYSDASDDDSSSSGDSSSSDSDSD